MVAEIRDGRGLITTIEKDCEYWSAGVGKSANSSTVVITGKSEGKGFHLIEARVGKEPFERTFTPGDAIQLADGIVVVAK
ncbi:MAG: hypothetical protein AAB546_00990 [Patescibacteria group bacterium]